MIIDIYPSYCLLNGDRSDFTFVYDTLSFFIPGSEHSKLFKNGHWDGTRHFFRERKFPVGLLSYVLRAAGERRTVVLNDHRKFPKIDEVLPQLNTIELRDYQNEAIVKCLEHKNCIIEVATNGGKTAIFSGVIKMMHPHPTLVLINRAELLDQTVKFIERYTGLECGFITANNVLLKPVTVAMIATLKNRLECDEYITSFFNNTKCIIVDECHHAKSPSYHEILELSQSPYRLGFSGTVPERKTYDGALTRAFIGDVVYKISNDQLIDLEVSAKPKIFVYEMDVSGLMRGVHAEAKAEMEAEIGELYSGQQLMKRVYKKVVERGIVNNDERNGKTIEIINNHLGKSVLIVVDFLDHGEIIEKLLNGNGINAVFISGKAEHRTDALNDFKAGKLVVLISTNIIDEGLDISRIEVLILLAGKKSRRQLLQRIGRSLRRKEGDNTVSIFDFVDMCKPNSVAKSLLKHSKERLAIYKEEQFAVEFL